MLKRERFSSLQYIYIYIFLQVSIHIQKPLRINIATEYLGYCRFQVTFQRAVPKFVANLPITFPSSEIGRELSYS
jgi:hypothetical protein